MAFVDVVNEVTGITGQSRDSFLNRLKDEYLPAWEDHVHTELVLPGIIAKKKGTMGGRRSLTSLMVSYPQSTGIALFENDDLPVPSVGTYINPSIFSRTIYSRLRWTGHVERSARKGDKVSWAAPRAEDLRTARKQFELNFARMLYLGPAQVVGTIKTYSSDTSWTVYGRDARNSQAANRHKYGAHYLRVNMDVHTVDEASMYGAPIAIASRGRITAISNVDEAVLTLTEAATELDGDADDFIIPFGSRNANAADGDANDDSNFAGPNGLMNLAVDDGIKTWVYGIDRTTAGGRTLNAFVFDNGSDGVRPFNEDYITLAVDRVSDDGTGDDPDKILCHRSIRREYVKEVKDARRFPEVQGKRGFKGLQQIVGDVGLPLVTDRDCMPGVMWILESDGFGWFSEADMQMADEGERFVADKDAHEIVMVKSGNLATRKPHNNAMVDDLQYSVTGLTDL